MRRPSRGLAGRCRTIAFAEPHPPSGWWPIKDVRVHTCLFWVRCDSAAMPPSGHHDGRQRHRIARPLSPALSGLLRVLCVVLRIAPDARLERPGSNLRQEMTLPVEERGLETPIAMPTLHTPVPLVMPVGIPPGTVLCVPQEGEPESRHCSPVRGRPDGLSRWASPPVVAPISSTYRVFREAYPRLHPSIAHPDTR